MPAPFLSSEEYDERAHKLYDSGDYDGALDTLKEALQLYPHSVELHVGLGYTRLAREEFGWARQAFERGLVLDPEHEDGLVGLGEVLLRFGGRQEALELFEKARRIGALEDIDLLLSMGRALYRERLFNEAREVFVEAAAAQVECAEAEAALGYTLHRLGDEVAARRRLRRALQIDAQQHEARIYLAHLLYDRGEWKRALREFEAVPVAEHWDTLAIWRLLELKRAIEGVQLGGPEVAVWEKRLEEIEAESDPLDDLLAELEAAVEIPDEARVVAEPVPAPAVLHRVQTSDGRVYAGSWLDILRQLRDARGSAGDTIAQFMRREAERERVRTGADIPVDDPETFLRASARAGLLRIEC